MKTEKRISCIVEAVTLAKNEFFNDKIVVADIATDHGYIAEELSKKDYVKNVIASDISEKSLQKLKNLIKFHHLSGINCVFCDGLEAIDYADISVIAGIGGFEIIKILSTQNANLNGKRKCDVFVLQPAQNVIELREYLLKNNYYILRDYIVEDKGRFYPIIVVNVNLHQKNKESIFNLWLGRDNKISSADFILYLNEILELLKFLDDIPRERIRKDKVLSAKLKLKKLVCKLLNKRRNIC